ncbi:F-box-like domain-containing protein [Robbsia andropogonis]|uniref:F-box-like domain-containing protein n=1 Tax=Robbsia andropogonis TaxID=28092 RepID=UPI0004649A85|nr:F-box-like domain-containing protein [Robbsia andropogonis]
MRIITYALTYLSSESVERDNSDNDENIHRQPNPGTLQKLPDELLTTIFTALQARGLFNIGLVSKRLRTLIVPLSPSSITAIQKIGKVRTGRPAGWLFFQAIKSIEAASVSAHRPALLRELILAVPTNYRRRGCTWDTEFFDNGCFFKAISAQYAMIIPQPKLLSDTLALIDLFVAHFVAYESFDDNAMQPIDLMRVTDKAFWPAMLDSLLMDVPACHLKSEIRLFCDEYHGPENTISWALAWQMATSRFR